MFMVSQPALSGATACYLVCIQHCVTLAVMVPLFRSCQKLPVVLGLWTGHKNQEEEPEIVPCHAFRAVVNKRRHHAPPASISCVTTSTMSTERPRGEVPMPSEVPMPMWGAPPADLPSDAGQSGPLQPCGSGGLGAPPAALQQVGATLREAGRMAPISTAPVEHEGGVPYACTLLALQLHGLCMPSQFSSCPDMQTHVCTVQGYMTSCT